METRKDALENHLDTLNSLLPFIGTGSAIWVLGAIIFAVFPGNRKGRLKSAAIAFMVLVGSAIVSTQLTDTMIENKLETSDVESSEKITSMSKKKAAEKQASAYKKVLNGYIEKLNREIKSIPTISARSYTDSTDTIVLATAMFDVWAMIYEEGNNIHLSEDQKN